MKQTSQNKYLQRVVGLESAKRKLDLFLDIYHETGYFKNLGLVGGKGTGKTLLAREIGRELKGSDGKPRDFYEINCSSMSSLKEFFNDVGEYLNGESEVTFFFDEAEQLPKEINIALLTLLEVNNQKKTKYNHQGTDYLVDFSKATFIFGTTNIEKLLEPLRDRLEIISIPTYTQPELKEILAKYLEGVKVNDDILSDLASVVRSNPRACVKLSENIKGFLQTKKTDTLTLEGCKEIYNRLVIYPLGITYSELQILEILNKNPDCSLTRLGAITGKNVNMLRKFEEIFLQTQGLIEIRQATGRNITTKGRKYLNQLSPNQRLTV